MKCLYCGYEVENGDVCINCGSDLSTYRRILNASALCYNEGLRKARVRDLSGAIDELTKALKYNKYNTDARNLLGLVYFEIGEPVNAMAEWVISQSLSPNDNMASDYLKELQSSPATLNRMDDATKKYNQAVSYVRNGDIDLAKIQLKRLVGKNPAMIRARSLLALIYMKEGEPKSARKELVAAAKIDVGNPTINTYFQEVKNGNRNQNASKRNKKQQINDAETIVSDDTSRFSYVMDYSKVSIINIIIGGIMGVLISLFLIFPAMKQYSNSSTMNALLVANEDKRSNENDITVMQQTIDSLNSKLEEYEGKSDIRTSYENLVAALNSVRDEDMESASRYFESVSKEVLDPKGKQAYDELSETVGAYVISVNYETALANIEEEKYSEATALLLTVVEASEEYDEGKAIFNLALCYENMGDMDNALIYYSKTKELYPGRRIGRNADAKIKSITNGEEYVPENVPENVPEEEEVAAEETEGTEGTDGEIPEPEEE